MPAGQAHPQMRPVALAQRQAVDAALGRLRVPPAAAAASTCGQVMPSIVTQDERDARAGTTAAAARARCSSRRSARRVNWSSPLVLVAVGLVGVVHPRPARVRARPAPDPRAGPAAAALLAPRWTAPTSTSGRTCGRSACSRSAWCCSRRSRVGWVAHLVLPGPAAARGAGARRGGRATGRRRGGRDRPQARAAAPRDDVAESARA